MNIRSGLFNTKLPKGFSAGGINCGVRKYRPDLGIIISDVPSVAVAVFTQNDFQGAHVTYCQSILPSEDILAIITNSSEANAATGNQGIDNNLKMTRKVASSLQCKASQVLTASTGVIGKQLSINKIIDSVDELIAGTSNIAEKFAVSILTTDLVPKAISIPVKLSTGNITLTGICKGSGMISPNMATMLGYILTDAKIDASIAKKCLSTAVNMSFNMISVDGDMSPNDTVFLLANGNSEASIVKTSDIDHFQSALNDLCIILAKSIARDGEGATKLIEVNVKGLDEVDKAKKVALSVVDSPLIKTAIHGEDANWGRILSRIGQFKLGKKYLEQCSLSIQGVRIYPELKGTIEQLNKKMKRDTVQIDLEFSSSDQIVTAWGCDLSKKYVQINSEYYT